MSRVRSNCSTICAEPTELFDVISVTPAMRVNCFSSGVATAAAITSGLAPGRLALTKMVGKSTSGSADTGKSVYASPPASVIATSSSEVRIGRLMNGVERLMRLCRQRAGLLGAAQPGEPRRDAPEEEIDDGRREQRQHLADEQPADDADAERLAQLRSHAAADSQRHRAGHPP